MSIRKNSKASSSDTCRINRGPYAKYIERLSIHESLEILKCAYSHQELSTDELRCLSVDKLTLGSSIRKNDPCFDLDDDLDQPCGIFIFAPFLSSSPLAYLVPQSYPVETP